jgi:iron(III) transport system substrate-binding protein
VNGGPRLAPRRAVVAGLVAAVVGAAFACDRPAPRASTAAREVVLYSSADPDVLRPVVEVFEKETGIRVKTVGDTEATKTTGLVQRVIAEKDRPRADAWWSSEAMGTILLSSAGLLEPYTSEAAERGSPWPASMRGSRKDWYGIARRARVLVYNTRHVAAEQVPGRLAGLAEPRFRGRLVMARPQFGTTRGHMAALLHAHGEAAFAGWLRALRDNGVRLLDGNASVVRAVANGEAWIGLADTDDVHAGIRNGWPVAMVLVGNEILPTARDGAGAAVRHFPEAEMQVPSTVAVVRGAPHPEQARRLLDFLVSPRVERMLADGPWKTDPVNRAAFDPPLDPIRDDRWVPVSDLDLEAAAARTADAIRLCEEILGR